MVQLLSDAQADALAASNVRAAINPEIVYGRGPEFHFDPACPTCNAPGYSHLVVRDGRIGEVSGLANLGQWMRAALATDRGAYPIYSEQFGSDFTDLYHESNPETATVAEQLTTEALQADVRVAEANARTTDGTMEVAITTFDGTRARLSMLTGEDARG